MRSKILAAFLTFLIPITVLATRTNETSRATFTADGIAVQFIFNFPAQSPAHIAVYVNEVRQVSGFTTTLNASQGTSPGGRVTFLAPPADDAVIRIDRIRPLTQTTALPSFSQYRAKDIENTFDAVVEQAQQIDRRVSDLTSAQDARDDAQDAVIAGTLTGPPGPTGPQGPAGSVSAADGLTLTSGDVLLVGSGTQTIQKEGGALNLLSSAGNAVAINAGAVGTWSFLGNLTAPVSGLYTITGLPTPANSGDAATKGYVDAVSTATATAAAGWALSINSIRRSAATVCATLSATVTDGATATGTIATLPVNYRPASDFEFVSKIFDQSANSGLGLWYLATYTVSTGGVVALEFHDDGTRLVLFTDGTGDGTDRLHFCFVR